MRYVKLDSQRKLTLSQILEPNIIEKDDVKIKIYYAPINADDYHIFKGTLQTRYFADGLGHEFVGKIVDLGSEAKRMGLSIGDYVSGIPTLQCGKCPLCKKGKSNLCLNSNFFTSSGTFSEYIIRKDRQLIVVTKDILTQQAALLWLIMTCAHCIQRAHPKMGQTALILGGGTSGLILAQLLKKQGLPVVAVCEPIAAKRKMALQLGATHVVHPKGRDAPEWYNTLTNGLGFDLIIDASDNIKALSGVTGLLGRGGALVLFSLYTDIKSLPISPEELYYKECIIYSSTAAVGADYMQNAIGMMKMLQLSPLIGKVFPIDQVEEAMLAYESRIYTRILLEI